jgi:V/A-type H+-transporting ATPase subunit C
MALYDYGNARLRARLSELQPKEKLESWADLSSIDSFLSALTKTPYQEAIEKALTFAHGYECINQAMKFASAEILEDLMRFYQSPELETIKMIFFRSDLQNLKAIFRGVLHGIALDQVTSSFSHMGTISEPVLKNLAKAESLAELINRMAVYGLPVSQPLLELRFSREMLNSADIELAMERWYFHEINKMLTGASENVRILDKFYQIEADIINLNTVLRFVGSEIDRGTIGEKFQDYILDAGYLGKPRMLKLAQNRGVDNLVRSLLNTRYGTYLRIAIECFQSNQLLSEFENQMRIYMLQWTARLPRRHPLGIGVPLGYVSLKRSEIKNLRWIAKGITSGFEPTYIRDNLERIQ